MKKDIRNKPPKRVIKYTVYVLKANKWLFVGDFIGSQAWQKASQVYGLYLDNNQPVKLTRRVNSLPETIMKINLPDVSF